MRRRWSRLLLWCLPLLVARALLADGVMLRVADAGDLQLAVCAFPAGGADHDTDDRSGDLKAASPCAFAATGHAALLQSDVHVAPHGSPVVQHAPAAPPRVRSTGRTAHRSRAPPAFA